MIESTKGFTKTETEAEAEARAAAFAHNKNYNILYIPEAYPVDGYPHSSADGAATNEASYPSREDLEGLMKRFTDEDIEAEAEAKASGRASIKNINVNVAVKVH